MILNIFDYRPDEREEHDIAIANVDGVSIKIDHDKSTEQILKKIATSTNEKEGQIHKLRFFFHGLQAFPGMQLGKYQTVEYLPNIGLTDEKFFEAIKPYLGSDAEVELHSCEAAKGELGRKFIQSLADLLNATVIGGEKTQTHRDAGFEGWYLYKAKPGGKKPQRILNQDRWTLQSLDQYRRFN